MSSRTLYAQHPVSLQGYFISPRFSPTFFYRRANPAPYSAHSFSCTTQYIDAGIPVEPATALNAEVWVETVTEGGRRFMAAWRKDEVDAARHRQEEKREATRLGTLLSQTGV